MYDLYQENINGGNDSGGSKNVLYTNLYQVTNWCIMAISNFELTLLVRNSTYVGQILCGLRYKV